MCMDMRNWVATAISATMQLTTVPRPCTIAEACSIMSSDRQRLCLLAMMHTKAQRSHCVRHFQLHLPWPSPSRDTMRSLHLQEYLSVTITAGVTAPEFAEFCLDDTARLKWDFMLKAAKLISRGDPKKREQVVTWLRRWVGGRCMCSVCCVGKQAVDKRHPLI